MNLEQEIADFLAKNRDFSQNTDLNKAFQLLGQAGFSNYARQWSRRPMNAALWKHVIYNLEKKLPIDVQSLPKQTESPKSEFYENLPEDVQRTYDQQRELFNKEEQARRQIGEMVEAQKENTPDFRLLQERVLWLNTERTKVEERINFWKLHNRMPDQEIVRNLSDLSLEELFLKKSNLENYLVKDKKKIAEAKDETDRQKKLKKQTEHQNELAEVLAEIQKKKVQ